MNPTLEAFARSTLKVNLAKLNDANQRTFKLMYGRRMGPRHEFTRTVEQAVAMPVDDVVDQMKSDALDWAMTQTEASLKRPDCLRQIEDDGHHDYPNEPIGGGNPYWRCTSCGASDPQINGRLSGHFAGCQWVVNKRRELSP